MPDNSKLDTVVGTVNKITYKNENNGYTVLNITASDNNIVCVGTLPDVKEGESIKAYGNYTIHSSYGQQFKISSYEVLTPEGSAAILRYLSSGVIKGIGPATARIIVERFGDISLEIIEKDYERLADIRGISIAKAKKISNSYKNQSSTRQIVMALSNFGITADESLKIYKELGKNTLSQIEDNPYILYNENIGFSFEKVCEIAAEFQNNSNMELFKTEAGIIFVLRHNLLNGHTCLPLNKLKTAALNLLGCNEEIFNNSLNNLRNANKVIIESINNKQYAFLYKYHTAERYICSKLKIMLEIHPKEILFNDKTIYNLEKENNITYEQKQIDAINMALKKGVLVLTGGPGTGKTTTLKAIKSILDQKDFNVALAAPTGRAAKRLSELAGCEAKTIHRLLEVEWNEHDNQVFTRNEKNPLTCDAIIIDEMSMVDSLLMESLLRALPLGSRIIMVGDSNQLPSVGPGNVLSDIIASSIVPIISLTQIFRQAEQSDIIINAHKIVSGEHPIINNNKDMFIIENTSKNLSQYIVDLYCNRLPKAYNYNKFTDIQVLCPSKKTPVGTIILNDLLQQNLNPKAKDKTEVKFKEFTFRQGDKVMQIKNNYDKEWVSDGGEYGMGVYNGDIGLIEDISLSSQKLTIRFDDKIAVYNFEEVNQLELSYAITIHKSQGSEFNCVIIPLLDTPDKLKYRNLLYTAVTRAKQNLILVGSMANITQMIDNNRKSLRYTGLLGFLKE